MICVRKLSVLGFLLVFSGMIVVAQEWSREDSIWLKNVLEGKEELKINEETKKAIEEGRLIIPSWIRNDDNSGFDLLKDFDNGVEPDDSVWIHRINPYTMPPAVFAMYVLYLDKMDSVFNVKSLIITESERKQLEELLPTRTRNALFYSLPNGASGVGLTTDFNHLLSMVFSAQYRRIAYNRKHATAYKNYYDNGTQAGSIRITEQERKQLMQSVNNRKMSIKVNYGSKVNGIDD